MKNHLESVEKRLKQTRGRRKTTLSKNTTLNSSVADHAGLSLNEINNQSFGISVDPMFNAEINAYRLRVNKDYLVMVKPDSYLYSVNRHNGDHNAIGFIGTVNPVTFSYLPYFDVNLSIVHQTAIIETLNNALENDDSFYQYCVIMGVNADTGNKILYAEIESWSLSKRKRIIKRAWGKGINTENIAYNDIVSLAKLYIQLCK